MSLLLTVSGQPGPALPSISGNYDPSAQLWHPRLAGSALAETLQPTPSATTALNLDMDTDDQSLDPDPDPPSHEP